MNMNTAAEAMKSKTKLVKWRCKRAPVTASSDKDMLLRRDGWKRGYWLHLTHEQWCAVAMLFRDARSGEVECYARANKWFKAGPLP